MILAFDMDGTICEHSQVVPSKLFLTIANLTDKYSVWIVTGANVSNAKRQLGGLFELCDKIYVDSGSSCWKHGRLISKDNKQVTEQLLDKASKLPFGRHTKIINNSIVISALSPELPDTEKQKYLELDRQTKYRQAIVDAFNASNSEKAIVSGRTSIILANDDFGKHIILEETNEPIWYFCDEADNGNDATIAKKLYERSNCKVFKVDNYSHTHNILEDLLKKGIL